MNKILLDTNAYTGFNNHDKIVFDHIIHADVVCFSAIVLGELYDGFYGGTKGDWNIANLHGFLERKTVRVINVTHATAKIFGTIKNELKHKGKMIPLNDIWIAAQAIETDSTLITYDGHYKVISGLKLWQEI